MSGKVLEETSDERILECRAKLPQHVVYRVFVKETVLLNLKTGKYHGLNPTAGRILDILRETGSVAATAERLAKEYDAPLDRIRSDVADLCEQLRARDLIELTME